MKMELKNKELKKINFWEFFTIFGSLGFYILSVIFITFYEFYTLSFKLILAIIFAISIISSIRLYHYKPRPIKEKFSTMIGKIKSSSFPSMHASASLILFGFLTYEFFSILTLLICTVLFLLVCISRIYLKKHFTVDVLAGAFLGIVILIIIEIISTKFPELFLL